MTTSANPKFKQLTALQIRAVDKCLEAHCFADPQEAGRCIYEAGWDDARVAEEAIPEYPGRRAHVVGNYRLRLGYGRVISKAHKPQKAGDQKLADLEARISALEALTSDVLRHVSDNFNRSSVRSGQTEKLITDTRHRLSQAETSIHHLQNKVLK